jgi:hypothetical protein
LRQLSVLLGQWLARAIRSIRSVIDIDVWLEAITDVEGKPRAEPGCAQPATVAGIEMGGRLALRLLNRATYSSVTLN